MLLDSKHRLLLPYKRKIDDVRFSQVLTASPNFLSQLSSIISWSLSSLISFSWIFDGFFFCLLWIKTLDWIEPLGLIWWCHERDEKINLWLDESNVSDLVLMCLEITHFYKSIFGIFSVFCLGFLLLFDFFGQQNVWMGDGDWSATQNGHRMRFALYLVKD